MLQFMATHLDSMNHERTQGIFNFQTEADTYMPVQHMALLNEINICEHFLADQRKYNELSEFNCRQYLWLNETALTGEPHEQQMAKEYLERNWPR
jgi:hypothetical protein